MRIVAVIGLNKFKIVLDMQVLINEPYHWWLTSSIIFILLLISWCLEFAYLLLGLSFPVLCPFPFALLPLIFPTLPLVVCLLNGHLIFVMGSTYFARSLDTIVICASNFELFLLGNSVATASKKIRVWDTYHGHLNFLHLLCVVFQVVWRLDPVERIDL